MTAPARSRVPVLAALAVPPAPGRALQIVLSGLHDPPRYVAIPPELIYQAHDLERETCKALL